MILADPFTEGFGSSAHRIGYLAWLGIYHGQPETLLARGEDVNFYQVVLLYREELEYKLKHGTEALIEKMTEVDFVVHPNRPNSITNSENKD